MSSLNNWFVFLGWGGRERGDETIMRSTFELLVHCYTIPILLSYASRVIEQLLNYWYSLAHAKWRRVLHMILAVGDQCHKKIALTIATSSNMTIHIHRIKA